MPNIVFRNLFRILRSGAFNEYEPMEAMSSYKWEKLCSMVRWQHVGDVAVRGIKNHTFDKQVNMPRTMTALLEEKDARPQGGEGLPQMCSIVLNKRLKRIQENERHEIDASMPTLEMLHIIVGNQQEILQSGFSLRMLMEMGLYLRRKGDKVDFVKLEKWLKDLHMEGFATLEGNLLMEIFGFSQDEIPFLKKEEVDCEDIILETLLTPRKDEQGQWHFKQRKNGFLKNNTHALRNRLRHNMKYARFGPYETSCHLLHNLVNTLGEIEE